MLLSPYVPLLFMGEEYGETAPFLYFIEHGDPELIEAVRAGRRREFESIGLAAAAQIDPQAEETFARSRLDWSRRDSASGALLLALYTDLLSLRREEPTLKPGASVIHVEGSADWCTTLRSTPLQGDIFDQVRAHYVEEPDVKCGLPAGRYQERMVSITGTGTLRVMPNARTKGEIPYVVRARARDGKDLSGPAGIACRKPTKDKP